MFDPLGIANNNNNTKNNISIIQQQNQTSSSGSSGFHLQDENTSEHKIKQLEQQICRLLDESVNAAVAANSVDDLSLALELAKDCVAKERSLNRLKEQSGLIDQFGPNTDLTFATIFNLAEQYTNSRMWPEAINTYQSILKNRSFTNTGIIVVVVAIVIVKAIF